MSNIGADLIFEGVSEVKYYYYTLPIIGNIFTVCLLLKDKKILSRGVSICSVLDTHNKKIAREKSRKRAITALFSKKNSLEIEKNGQNNQISIERRLEKGDVIRDFTLNDDYIEELIENSEKLGLTYKKLDTNRIRIFIPYFFPMDVTKTFFNYKSEFNPEMTNDEKKICRV